MLKNIQKIFLHEKKVIKKNPYSYNSIQTLANI